MKKRTTPVKTAAGEKQICPLKSLANNESMVAFEEKPDKSNRREQNAQRLFESFTASIIQENIIFTR